MLLLGCLCSTWRCPQEPPRHRHLHGVPISTGCQAELLLQHQQHPSQPLNVCWGPRSDPHRHRRAGTRDAQGNAAPAQDQTGARGPSCAISSGRTAASAAGSGHPGDTEAARWDAPAWLNHPEKALCQQQAVLPVPHGGTGGTKGSSGAFGGRIGRSEGGTAACPRLRNPPEAGWSPSPHLPRQEAPLSPPKLIHRYLRISSRVTGPQPPERWHRGSRSKTTNSQGTFFFLRKQGLGPPSCSRHPRVAGSPSETLDFTKAHPQGLRGGSRSPAAGLSPCSLPSAPRIFKSQRLCPCPRLPSIRMSRMVKGEEGEEVRKLLWESHRSRGC